jgi:hypothetical protein
MGVIFTCSNIMSHRTLRRPALDKFLSILGNCYRDEEQRWLYKEYYLYFTLNDDAYWSLECSTILAGLSLSSCN